MSKIDTDGILGHTASFDEAPGTAANDLLYCRYASLYEVLSGASLSAYIKGTQESILKQLLSFIHTSEWIYSYLMKF